MEINHIIRKESTRIGIAYIQLRGSGDWECLIENIKEPSSILLVDNKYQIPSDAELLYKEFQSPYINVNRFRFGLIEGTVTAYYSPSTGVIFQIEDDYYVIHEDYLIYD